MLLFIVTTVAAPFRRFQLRKLLLPVAQHVWFYRAKLADFPNREIALLRDSRQHPRRHIHARQTASRTDPRRCRFIPNVDVVTLVRAVRCFLHRLRLSLLIFVPDEMLPRESRSL